MDVGDLEVDDLVDVCGSEGTWHVAKVSEVDSDYGYRVNYYRNGVKSAEWIAPSSKRIALFRIKTTVKDYFSVPKSAKTLQKHLESALNCLHSSQFPAKSVTFLYRGVLYSHCLSIFQSQARTSEEMREALQCVEGVVRLVGEWVGLLPEWVQFVGELGREAAYVDGKAALACAWQELFALIRLIVDDQTELYKGPIALQASQDYSISSFPAYFWPGIYSDIIEKTAFFLTTTPPDLTISLTLLTDLPGWKYISTYTPPLLASFPCNYLLHALKNVFQAWEMSPNIAFEEYCKVQTVWEAVFAAKRYLALLNFECETLIRPVFTLFAKLLSHQSIEKRISVVSLLNSMVKNSDFDVDLGGYVGTWAQNEGVLATLMFDDPHPEVIYRCQEFVKWLYSQGILDVESLCGLFKSTVTAHESHSECVHSLLLTLSPHFHALEISRLGHAICSTEGFLTNPKILQFAGVLCANLNPNLAESREFAGKILEVFLEYISKEETYLQPQDVEVNTVIYQVCFDVLRLKLVKSLTSDVIKHLLKRFFLSYATFQPQIVYQLLDTFKGTEELRRNLSLKVRERILIELLSENCSLMILDYDNSEYEKERITWTLKCFDLLACSFCHYFPESVQVCQSSFLQIYADVCLEDGGVAEEIKTEFLRFLVDCANSSLWCTELIWTIVLQKVGREMLQRLTMSQYQALYMLFLRVNKGVIGHDDGVIWRVYADYELYNFQDFIRISMLPTDSDVREVARKTLNCILTTCDSDNTPLVTDYIFSLFALISTDPALHIHCLQSLQHCIDFSLKYQRVIRDEAELTLCVKEWITLAQDDPKSAAFDLDQYFREAIRDYVRENEQFMQVKFVPPKQKTEEFRRNMVLAPYYQADYRAVLSLELREKLLDALGSQVYEVHALALGIIKALLPGSSPCKDIEQLQHTYSQTLQSKFKQRLFTLLVLQELSNNSHFLTKYRDFACDLLTLLHLVALKPSEIEVWVTGLRHCALLYFETLLSLLHTHFSLQLRVLPTENALEMLTSLQVITRFYSLPTTENTHKSCLLEVLGRIIVKQIEQNDCFLDIIQTGCFEELFYQTFLEQILPVFAVQVTDFLKFLCEKDVRFSDFFLQIALNCAADAISKGSEWYFSTLSFLFLQNIDFSPYSEAIFSLSTLVKDTILTPKLEFPVNLWVVCMNLLPYYSISDVKLLLNFALTRLFTSFPDKSLLLSFISAVKMTNQSLELEIFTELSQIYRDFSWRKSDLSYFKLNPAHVTSISHTGFRNPGAICYINSAFQQLFAISAFRERVLRVNCEKKQPLLMNFQRILGKLKYKRGGAVSAEKILYSLRDTPMDLREQSDIEEFWNEFLHVLDTQLQEIGESELVSDCFRGITETKFTGKQGCHHSKSTFQPFLILNLTMKNKRNLQESLSAFTKEELMAGTDMYRCETCDTKVPTQNSTRIHFLPNVLVMSLGRFEYNLALNRRYKLTDKFEFPMEVSLKPLSNSPNYPEDYYQYHLQGVIIHQGTAESGHYYSLIRHNSAWLKCNDQIITPFDQKNIGKEAFGGVFQYGETQICEKSAYLLIYKREKFYRFREENERKLEIIENEGKEGEIGRFVEEIRRKYEEMREIHAKLDTFLSVEYVEFVRNLLLSENLTTKSLIFSLSYFLTIYMRRSNWLLDRSFFPVLLSALPKIPNIAFWTTEVLSLSSVLDEFILHSPVHVHKSVILIIKTVLQTANSTLIAHFLTRLIGKMETLDNVFSKDYKQFFELMYVVVEKARKEALELKLAERLVEKMMPGMQKLDKLEQKELVFMEDSYLGHPFPVSVPSHPSSIPHFGFQLLILSLLFPSLPALHRYFLTHIPNLPFNILLLNSDFELKQASKVLKYAKTDLTPLFEVLSRAFSERKEEVNGMKILLMLPTLLECGKMELPEYLVQLLVQEGEFFSPGTWFDSLLEVYRWSIDCQFWEDEQVLSAIQAFMLRTGHSDSNIAEFLQIVTSGHEVGPLRDLFIDCYGENIQEGRAVKVLAEGGYVKARVLESWGIATVVEVQTTQEVLCIPAEDDIYLD